MMKIPARMPDWLTIFFFVVSIALTAAMLYSARNISRMQSRLPTAMGAQADSFYAFTQVELAYERLGQAAMRRELSGGEGGADTEEQFAQSKDVLRRDFDAFSIQSDAEGYATQIPRYADDFATLHTLIDSLDAPPGRTPGRETLHRIDEARAPIERMAEGIRSIKLDMYAADAGELSSLRVHMYLNGLLLWTDFFIWIVILLLNEKSSRMLIRQMEAAIEASHQGFVKAQILAMNKNMLLGTISHELRTPLQTIISSIELLTLRAPKAASVDRTVIERLDQASVQLEAQLRDLSDYARLDAEKLTLRHANFNPATMLKKTVAAFECMVEKKGLKLVAHIPDDQREIHSDEDRIRQIAANLISNAVKYCDSGVVTVTLDPLPPGSTQLKFSVRDTGPGISRDDLERLFEPFTQIDQSHTRRHDGAGLGLAIVKRLVDLFQGSIHVDSTVGYGTCFEVSLPLLATADEKQADTEEAIPYPLKSRILLIDDNADICTLLRHIVEQMGHQCDTADGGAKALELAAQRRYDAILLDIQMPQMDGFQVAEQIRTREGPSRRTPIVGISANALEGRVDAKQKYFDDFLVKPIRHGELGRTLYRMLSNSD